ncbi:Pirin [hydrothermal vent metagenome]|uniref:Pirin n=1 Tax=hydrothermal vent metagenome TaxID=652676 RepID=A0A3B0RTZ6_9ZZZZ
MTVSRKIIKICPGLAASDGAGVKLIRLIGSPELDMLDPFLLFDNFESDDPDDYIGGFPSHPHRGFETVTYILAGRMRHKDNAGHEGVIAAGDVQWMTAGRGIIHSEMPEQEDGLLQGFQLWVNLPAKDKMMAPRYQEFSAKEIPFEVLDNGVTIKVISGETDRGTAGMVRNTSTNPLYFDISLKAGSSITQSLPEQYNAFIYVIEGAALANEDGIKAGPRDLAILGNGDHITIMSPDEDSRLLLIAGERLNEPVARAGPFVMNTRAEVLQAFQDYQNGNF